MVDVVAGRIAPFQRQFRFILGLTDIVPINFVSSKSRGAACFLGVHARLLSIECTRGFPSGEV